MTIGVQLQQLRETLGLSIPEAARRTGLTSENVLRVEGNTAYLSTALRYAAGLNRVIAFRINRDRKARIVDIAAAAGVSVDTVMRALPTLTDPRRAHSEAGDLQLSTVHSVCEATGSKWFVLRTR